MIKILIKYSDWLILNRGEIKSEVDDVVIPIDYLDKCKVTSILNSDPCPIASNFISREELFKKKGIEFYFVEIDYNPNETLNFIEWLYNNDWNLCATDHCSKNGVVEETSVLFNKFEEIIHKTINSGFYDEGAKECTKLCIEELTKLVKEVVHTTYEALDSNFSDKSYNKAIEESLKLINKYETNLG